MTHATDRSSHTGAPAAAGFPGDRVRELRERGYDDARQGRARQRLFNSEADGDAYADGVARAEAEQEEAAGGPPSLVERLVRALEASLAFWTPDQEAEELRRQGMRCAAANVQDWKRGVEALVQEARSAAAPGASSAPTAETPADALHLGDVRLWSVTLRRDGSVRHYAAANAWGEEWMGIGATRAEALADLVSTLS